VGGNANFLELLNKELEKQGDVQQPLYDPIVEESINNNTNKPKKTFLKKGKKLNEIQQKEQENRQRNERADNS